MIFVVFTNRILLYFAVFCFIDKAGQKLEHVAEWGPDGHAGRLHWSAAAELKRNLGF